MKSKLCLTIAGLLIGLGISAIPRPSAAYTVTCDGICTLAYHICIQERGLKNGCGRERRECLNLCSAYGNG
ncbi:MAG: hypothetical protein IT479_12420 [Xanthomonadales bacterium]|nr:hypothetical protein [Xanthomonadales bacterium]MCC6594058.1 hypothetical protein [Xanthomonadales bacterium]MCE7930888.1 hypothetical protein [Xanthomonadales bacterium PRO6]